MSQASDIAMVQHAAHERAKNIISDSIGSAEKGTNENRNETKKELETVTESKPEEKKIIKKCNKTNTSTKAIKPKSGIKTRLSARSEKNQSEMNLKLGGNENHSDEPKSKRTRISGTSTEVLSKSSP